MTDHVSILLMEHVAVILDPEDGVLYFVMAITKSGYRVVRRKQLIIAWK